MSQMNTIDSGMLGISAFGDRFNFWWIFLQIRGSISDEYFWKSGSISAELPALINDGFNAGDLLSLLDQFQPKGIVLEGGNEIRPGYKDFNELADILELLEIDDLA